MPSAATAASTTAAQSAPPRGSSAVLRAWHRGRRRTLRGRVATLTAALRRRSDPCLYRLSDCCAASSFAAALLPWRGLADALTGECGEKRGYAPRDAEITASRDSGAGSDRSTARAMYQRLLSLLTETDLTLPARHDAGAPGTCPMPWKRTRVTRPCGVKSHWQPSPYLGKSTISKRTTPRRRG